MMIDDVKPQREREKERGQDKKRQREKREIRGAHCNRMKTTFINRCNGMGSK